MDVIGFLCVSLGSSTVQLHDSQGDRWACVYSEVGFSSQNGDRALEVYYRRAAFSYEFFLWAKGLNAKNIHKEMIPVYVGKCLSCKAIHNWVEKFSQGHSKVGDDARPCHPVESATEATMQWVEDLIQSHRKITTDSVATVLRCSHGLAYSIMQDHLKFRKLAQSGCPEN
jgi:hypothetical protein